jgi:hypothetical protein
MITIADIQAQLQAYLTEKITIHQFIVWFAAESWEVATLRYPEPGLFNLVARIKLYIAEFACRYRTDVETRERLRKLV